MYVYMYVCIYVCMYIYIYIIFIYLKKKYRLDFCKKKLISVGSTLKIVFYMIFFLVMIILFAYNFFFLYN